MTESDLNNAGTQRDRRGHQYVDEIRKVIQRHGANASFETCLADLQSEHGVTIGMAKSTFYKHRQDLFPEGVAGRAVAEPDVPNSLRVTTPKPPEDYLGKLVRFGCAVESVGGVAVARRMLDAIDGLKQVLQGGNHAGGQNPGGED